MFLNSITMTKKSIMKITKKRIWFYYFTNSVTNQEWHPQILFWFPPVKLFGKRNSMLGMNQKVTCYRKPVCASLSKTVYSVQIEKIKSWTKLISSPILYYLLHFRGMNYAGENQILMPTIDEPRVPFLFNFSPVNIFLSCALGLDFYYLK